MSPLLRDEIVTPRLSLIAVTPEMRGVHES